MATLASFIFSSSLSLSLSLSRPLLPASSSSYRPYLYPSFQSPLPCFLFSKPRKLPSLVLAFSNSPSSSLDPFESIPDSNSTDKKSVLAKLIQEIEPLDVSLIQKDVPPTTLDAMKRTISGMLGLLPSDQFQVFVEAMWEPLSRLLVSSMMTGYTLRNAEYRLCLERNLDTHERNFENQELKDFKVDLQQMSLGNVNIHKIPREDDLSSESDPTTENSSEIIDRQSLGEISREAEQYIFHLESRLSSVEKDLDDAKRKNAALQMQQFVGEEKNDLLDYLRSLKPEKVAELSEPTTIELKEVIQSVVHGLLATLSPRMHSKAPSASENTSSGTPNLWNEDCAELVENTLQFQPLISLTRDYLARLLFWCMLLGHYLRGLEYRMELTELLSLTSEDTHIGEDYL